MGEIARALETNEDVEVEAFEADSTAGDAHESRKVGGTVLTRTREELEKSWRHFTSMMRAPLVAPKGPHGQGFPENAKGNIRSSFAAIKAGALPWLKRRVTFYRIHFTCFVVVMLFGSLVMWISPNGEGGRISFVDAMYVRRPARGLYASSVRRRTAQPHWLHERVGSPSQGR